MHDLLLRLAGPGTAEVARLDRRSDAYLVLDGAADLFAVRDRAGAASRRHFVARIPAGGLVPGSTPTSDRPGSQRGAGRAEPDWPQWRLLLLVPLPGTRLRGITADRLRMLERHVRIPAVPDDSPGSRAARSLVDAVDVTLLAMADAVRDGQAPRQVEVLRAHHIVSVPAGAALTGANGVCWVRAAGGELVRNGNEPGGRSESLLLAGRDWVTARSECAVESIATWDLLVARLLWSTVEAHMSRLLRIIERRIDSQDAAFTQAIRERKQANAAVVAGAARLALGAVGAGRPLSTEPADRYGHYRRAAATLRLLTGAPVVEPAARSAEAASERITLSTVARSSALHLREVALPAGWWRRDLGPLIGWRDGRAVPLLFRRGRYHEVDPETLASVPLPASPAGFDQVATLVQPPLPVDTGLRHAFRLGLRGAGQDVRALLLCGLAAALLGLATPLVTGTVLGWVAGQDSTAGLLSFVLLLIPAAVVAALVAVGQNLRLLRLEGRAEIGTQLALWDRLMRLPVRFFRRTPSGELAGVMLGISFIREALSGLLAQTVAAALTVVADLMLLFAISPPIGLAALAVVTLAVGFTAVFGRLVAGRQRRALPAEHRVAALTNQLLGGITKIKLAGAEDRAYGRWSEANIAARTGLNRVRHAQSVLLAVGAALPIGGQLALFALLAGPLAGTVTPGRFFAVNIAFTLLLAALLLTVTTSVEVIAALPRLENLRDIVEASPERRPDKVDPGELRGEVTVSNVTFGYLPDDPPVLEDVSLSVAPGEFVAIVGPSGCGKSTLLRLLLGFETPRSGAILYDNQDLAELDVQAVRRQCGVVLQDGLLFAGSIRDNICGAGNFSLEQVWEAARMAGLADDLERLPMGVGTMVPFGGGTLSVGQRQRVLIARAPVNRPRILFFDEATSALDNRTQLAASRVIIAHRLSTVVNADRIVVLARGRVVQQPPYPTLISDPTGLFHRLARRQTIAPI